MAVPKSVHICGDFKVTINPVPQVEQYLVPRKKFSKLDMSHVHQEVLLEDESGKYVTINSSKIAKVGYSTISVPI